MKILVVEDDAPMRETLLQVLRPARHRVEVCADGIAARQALSSSAYDLVVLDLGLPGVDGVDVLRELRARRDRTPVLVLTARDDVDQRVHGLDAGADDYLTKPFALPEFEARVRALLRRTGGETMLELGSLRLQVDSRRATVGEHALDLAPREVAMLEALMRHPGQVALKSRLAQRFSDWDSAIGGNAIEVCVHRLRRKLEPLGIRIRTIYGLGYVLEAPPADDADGGG